ncbi:hypothetical protein [Limimaricola hongkongensis]|uniref:Uncharacterized protein n=1 Tax=Limimaricola hongkongensis DSM 17492 TaxID=1122180 RepID=A0A017HDA2_9RHOB|nr:hypothetical protein [Limimaricola hongkongensis]EYD72467.1 hypothetical protein Lokhon_01267 [Limimaricola hongkongensis DSM 17492]
MRIDRCYTLPGQDALADLPMRRVALTGGGVVRVPSDWPQRAARAVATRAPGGSGEDGLRATIETLVTGLRAAAAKQGRLDDASAQAWGDEMRHMVVHRIVALDPGLWGVRGSGRPAAPLPLPVRMAGAGATATARLAEAACDGAPLGFDFGAGQALATPRAVLDLRRFVTDGAIAVEPLVHAVRVWTLALALRGAGDLGLAGVGGAVMRLGRGFASREGRLAGAALAALADAARAATAAELGLAAGAGDARAAAGLSRLSRQPGAAPLRAALERAAGLRRAAARARGDGTAAPRIAIAPLGDLAAILGLGADPLAPVAALCVDVETGTDGHRHEAAPELRAGLAAQGHAPDRIAALLRHVAGHGSLVAAPGIDHAALRARGLDADQIARIEAALPEARDLRAVITPWRLGPAFCAARLGRDAEALPGHGLGLLSRLGFTEAQIEAANRHVFGTASLRGAPGMAPGDAAAFDGALATAPRARLAMAAALAGAIGGPVTALLPLPDAAAPDRLRLAIRAARRAGLAGLVPARDEPALAPRLREILAMLPPGTRPGDAPGEVIELIEAAGRSRPEARRHARALRDRLLADPLPRERPMPRGDAAAWLGAIAARPDRR